MCRGARFSCERELIPLIALYGASLWNTDDGNEAAFVTAAASEAPFRAEER